MDTLLIISSINKNTIQLDFYINAIFYFLKSLENEYVNFTHWFFNKAITGLHTGERKFLLYIKDQYLAGIAILKNNMDEKKICTLRVSPKFQRHGIGTKLLEKSFEILQTEKPLITVSNLRYAQFKKLFKKFNFKITGIKKNYYKHNTSEIIFNNELKTSMKIHCLFGSKMCKYDIKKYPFH